MKINREQPEPAEKRPIVSIEPEGCTSELKLVNGFLMSESPTLDPRAVCRRDELRAFGEAIIEWADQEGV